MVPPPVDLTQVLGAPPHTRECDVFSDSNSVFVMGVILGWHLGCSTHTCVIPSGKAPHISATNTKPRVKCTFHDIERPHSIAAVVHGRNTIATGWSFNRNRHRNVKTSFHVCELILGAVRTCDQGEDASVWDSLSDRVACPMTVPQITADTVLLGISCARL